MLCPCLGLLDEAQEVALALSESFSDSLDWILRKLFVLHDEIVQVVTQVVSAGRATMAIENTKEADLRPLDVEMLLVFRFENVQDYRNTIFVVVADDALVRVRCVRLDDPALLCAGLGRLVVL